MAARGGVEKLLEEVHISSASWLGDELLTAMSSEDISGGEIGLGGDDSDLDDLSSLSFSDSVQIPGNGMPDRPNFLYYGGTASKVVEAEEMKRESQRHSSELQMQNHELRHQNDILGMKLQHAQRRHSEEAARMRHALTAEVAASVERHKQETSVLREQLSARQDTLLGALRISEREYEEIAATPAQQRDLRQTIAAEAYLLLAVARRERDDARREAEAQRVEVEDLRALVVDRRVSSTRQEEGGTSLSEARARAAELQKQADEMRVSLGEHAERSRRCEEAESEAKLASAARDAAVEQIDDLLQRLAKVQKSAEQETGERETFESKVAMLELDKEFLKKEVGALASRVEAAEAKVEKKAFKNKELQRVKEALEEQLNYARTSASAHSGEKLEAELAHLRSRSEVEMGEIKKSTAELYARQNAMLQQRQEESAAEADRLRVRLDAASHERDAAVREHAQLLAAFEQQVGHVRSQLALKSAEAERLGLVNEEHQILIRQLRLESDMHREKAEVLKSEFFSLQSSSNAHVAELEATARAREDRISLFESSQPALRDALAAVQSEEHGGGLALTAGGVATGGTVAAMAQKVSHLKDRNAELRGTIQQQEDALAAVQLQLKDANRLLDSTQHPHNMLVQAVRARDTELQALKEHTTRLKVIISTITSERDRLRDQCLSLKTDVERLVANRDSSQQLHAAVADLREKQRASLARVAQLQAAPGGGGGERRFDSGGTLIAIEGGLMGFSGGGSGARTTMYDAAPQAVWYTKLKSRRPGA